MMLCCPMTSRIKNHLFEGVVSQNPPSAVLAEVRAEIRALIGL
jgi:mRNA interferase MazF